MISWTFCFLTIFLGPFLYQKLTGNIDLEEAFHRGYFLVLGAVMLTIMGPWR